MIIFLKRKTVTWWTETRMTLRAIWWQSNQISVLLLAAAAGASVTTSSIFLFLPCNMVTKQLFIRFWLGIRKSTRCTVHSMLFLFFDSFFFLSARTWQISGFWRENASHTRGCDGVRVRLFDGLPTRPEPLSTAIRSRCPNVKTLATQWSK